MGHRLLAQARGAAPCSSLTLTRSGCTLFQQDCTHTYFSWNFVDSIAVRESFVAAEASTEARLSNSSLQVYHGTWFYLPGTPLFETVQWWRSCAASTTIAVHHTASHLVTPTTAVGTYGTSSNGNSPVPQHSVRLYRTSATYMPYIHAAQEHSYISTTVEPMQRFYLQ